MPPPRAWLVLTLLFAACQSVGFVAKNTIPWDSFPAVVADKRVVVVGERHARVAESAARGEAGRN